MSLFLNDLESLDNILDSLVFEDGPLELNDDEYRKLKFEREHPYSKLLVDDQPTIAKKIYIKTLQKLLSKIPNVKFIMILPFSIFFQTAQIYVVFSELFGSETITFDYDCVHGRFYNKITENFSSFSIFLDTYPNVIKIIEEIENTCKQVNYNDFL